jgi:hypothetical protein
VAANALSLDEPARLADIQAAEAHHWPIVRAYAKRLGLRALINRLVAERAGVRSGPDGADHPGSTVGGASVCFLADISFEKLYYMAAFRRLRVGASTPMAPNGACYSGPSVVGPRNRLSVARRTSWY